MCTCGGQREPPHWPWSDFTMATFKIWLYVPHRLMTWTHSWWHRFKKFWTIKNKTNSKSALMAFQSQCEDMGVGYPSTLESRQHRHRHQTTDTDAHDLVWPSTGSLPFLPFGICHCILKAHGFLFDFPEIHGWVCPEYQRRLWNNTEVSRLKGLLGIDWTHCTHEMAMSLWEPGTGFYEIL